MKAMKARDLDMKFDLLFKMIDLDGNGMIDRDEIYHRCAGFFERFLPNVEDDKIMNSLCKFFTKLIFKAVDRDIDQEFPMIEIKDAIERGVKEADILCLFCGIDYYKVL